jgi:hemoglobin
MSTQGGEQTFYEAIGGARTIERIVHRFYLGVRADPLLRAIYPEEDLAPAEDRFTKFLIQYWGGPTTYSQERGHPRLRMRHAPFAVTHEAREHWLRHFRAGLDEVGLPAPLDAQFWDYVERASLMMVNTSDDDVRALPLQ